MTGLPQRIWEWLPARTTRARLTDPATCAAALDAPADEVARALADMAATGHAIRDRTTGRRAGHWHRGLPYPSPEPPPPTVEELGLWP